MENKRTTGTKYEELAARFLQERGYQVLERNFRCRYGEIDIIAKDGNCLAYVEVKYRGGTQKGYPGEAIDCKKQKKIYRVAQYYLYKKGIHPESQPCRFDAVLIEGEQIELVQNAFGGL